MATETITVGTIPPGAVEKLRDTGVIASLDASGPLSITCADRRPPLDEAFAFYDLPTTLQSRVRLLAGGIGFAVCANVAMTSDDNDRSLEQSRNPFLELAARFSTNSNLTDVTPTIHGSVAEEGPVGFNPGNKTSEPPDCYFLKNFKDIIGNAASPHTLEMAKALYEELSEDDSTLGKASAALLEISRTSPQIDFSRRSLLPYTRLGFKPVDIPVMNVRELRHVKPGKTPLVLDYRGLSGLPGVYHHSVAGAEMLARRLSPQLGTLDPDTARTVATLLGFGTALNMKAPILAIPDYES